MKIKEVHAGVKLTKNYDSYQASLVAELEIGEDPEKIGEDLMEKALAIVSKKIGLSNKQNLKKEGFPGIEVGAAWLGKTFKDRLSVKYSKTGNWEEVKIEDLEKTKEGYKQKTSEGIFIFKRIPEEKRANNKMPIFRIYKISGDIKNE